MWLFYDDAVWAWLALGIMLLIAEGFIASGFLLGASIAAFLTGFASLIFLEFFGVDVWWEATFTFWAVASVLITYALKRFFKPDTVTAPVVNDKMNSLIGKKFVTDEKLEGFGRVVIDGVLWSAESGDDLTIGDRAEVVAVKGMTLVVKKI